MAGNGGIIGPPNAVQTGCTSENITSFTSSGTFTAQANQTSADILVVAGGGGGGTVFGGGGGAGGLLATPNHPIPSSPVPITVGAGGSGYDASSPSLSPGVGTVRKGNNSVFGGAVPLTACGGGGGGCSAMDGGSGGGKSGFPGSPSPRPGGSGVCGQGNPGGAGACAFRSGGGGGAGGAGSTKGSNCTGGNGGAGATNDFASPTASPSNTTYAGGGGGGARSSGPFGSGGSGGGGRGASGPCGPPYNANDISVNMFGDANTGGGGGAVGEVGPGTPPIVSGSGGSGIVVIREQAQPFVTAPGVWSMNEVYEEVKNNNWTNS